MTTRKGKGRSGEKAGKPIHVRADAITPSEAEMPSAEGGAQPGQQLTTTTTDAGRVAELMDAPSMTELERQVLRLANVERADPHDIAAVLNEAQGTRAYNVERVAGILRSARGKLAKAGEVEASRPSAYAAQDTRTRYDALIAGLYQELARLTPPPVVVEPGQAQPPDLLTMARVKLRKTIAEVEGMRDAALAALSAAPILAGAGGLGIVYVSHLRGPAPAPARGAPAKGDPPPPPARG